MVLLSNLIEERHTGQTKGRLCMAASRLFTQNRTGHLSGGAPPKTAWAGRVAHGAQIIIRGGWCQGIQFSNSHAELLPRHRASWTF